MAAVSPAPSLAPNASSQLLPGSAPLPPAAHNATSGGHSYPLPVDIGTLVAQLGGDGGTGVKCPPGVSSLDCVNTYKVDSQVWARCACGRSRDAGAVKAAALPNDWGGPGARHEQALWQPGRARAPAPLRTPFPTPAA